MKDTMIRVEGLGKRYRIPSAQRGAKGVFARAPWRRDRSHDLWALRDVSFSVAPAEIVGIIGPNGAGKSTLLKVLTGITSPTTGRAAMRGRVASLLEVGTGFHPELTGRQNVFLNGTLLGMTRGEVRRKFDEIIDFAEVEEFLDTPMKHYSTGMQMRLAFAVAAHLDGEILIIDEALSVGDAAFQAKCMNAMKPVTSGGRSVLFVSHNMGTILDLCSRVVWLDGGRVVMCGSADEAVDGYLSAGLGEASPTEGSLTVGDHVPRSGSGKARIARIEVLDDDGEPCIGPRMGQGCTLRLHLRAQDELGRFLVGLRVMTSRGQRLFEMNNCEARQVLGPLRDGLVLDIHLDQVPLFPGKYGVTLTLRDASRHDLDILENVLALHVRPSAYLPATSPPLGPAYGLVAMPVRFEVVNAAPAVEVA